MAKKNIVDLFGELEDFIEGCKVQAFSNNKVVIPRDELLKRVREIKMKIPSEVEHSNKVVENRDIILAEARAKAEDVVQEARNEAQRLVNQSEIMRMATEQARELMAQAQAKAQEIVNQASQESDVLRLGALNYTNQTMEDLGEFTARFLEEEIERYQMLVDSLENQYKTIETNRAQIAAQLNSGQVPQGDGKRNITQAKRKAEPKKVEPKKAEPKKRETPVYTGPAPEIRVNTNHPAFSGGLDSGATMSSATVSAPKPAKSVTAADASASEASAPKPVKTAKPVRKVTGDLPVDDELDELDELYLDQF